MAFGTARNLLAFVFWRTSYLILMYKIPLFMFNDVRFMQLKMRVRSPH